MMNQSIAQTKFLAPLQQFPLTGECKGRFALTLANAQFLQGLLPPDLELAPNRYADPSLGLHPLMLMFDDVTLRMNANLKRIQEEYQLEALSQPEAFALRYNEFIAMLPFVRFKKGRLEDSNIYCFLPVLYLDNWLAVLGGRIFWEFNKLFSRFNVNANSYQVSDRGANLLLSSTSTLQGQPIPGSSVPNFVAITPILELSTVEYGRLGYVTSKYEVEYQGQNITPSSIEFTNHSSEYFPSGLSLAIPSITQNVMGCFDMTYNWKLSFIKFHPN